MILFPYSKSLILYYILPRNDAFHADTNAQVKRYKLEELEREKARLRSRHTELKPLLHLFEQTHV
jgi:hypothetical protein